MTFVQASLCDECLFPRLHTRSWNRFDANPQFFDTHAYQGARTRSKKHPPTTQPVPHTPHLTPLYSNHRAPDGASGALEDDAAPAAVSDDLSVVSTMSGVSSASGAVLGDLCFQLQGCYAVARFLERVSVLRRPGVVV